ncbi:hypothetical protein SAMN03080617_03765 [Algoriphagus alkaliphilus]|uniref:Uncharacterized protein n=2 Tax=Algoriphagus alkaliphilus TaxID=279824 RepID=A0A1G5ZGH4_9BACT|nr:hypothetical protein [Cyclobacterium sp.]SDA93656.1 hypothetical protein SAMN03080617_03765 [Algoriphagus alkaliphilus]
MEFIQLCNAKNPIKPMSLCNFHSFSAKAGKKILFLLTGLFLVLISNSGVNAQEAGKRQLGGMITATNNGVSIIPSFSLGRPAVFFDLTMGGERLSFDPMLRFAMDGKPWAFVLWGRYKLINKDRFTFTVGGHPAFIFQETEMMVNGKKEIMMVTNRYLAGELNSNYKLSDRVSMGIYYLRGTAIQALGPQNTNFLAFNTQISNIGLISDFKLRINPQVFFLKVDADSGYYLNSAFTFSKGDFPVNFQAFFNQKINSTVPGDDLVWNLGLLYNFSTTFSKK